MPEPAIEAIGLTKFYDTHRGIENVDLTVAQGEVFGFLGPNAAGKTTTIRLLLDYIRPTRGKVRVLGLDPRRDGVELRRRVGHVPGDLALYEHMTGEELLRFAANLRTGIKWALVEQLAERLQTDLSAPIHTLSRGNKQKVGLVHALMHHPELLVLDEPTTGLDPLMQQAFNQMVLEAKSEGRTVFLSSHILPEVEQVCDRVGIIREGRLIAVEEIRALKSRAVHSLEVRFAAPVAAESFSSLPGVREIVVEGSTVRFAVEGSLDPVVKALAKFEVEDLRTHEQSLEDIFLAFYGTEAVHAA